MLNEMNFHALYTNGTRRSRLSFFEKLDKNAEDLNADLKKEYHIEYQTKSTNA
jgi:hypothetical protein